MTSCNSQGRVTTRDFSRRRRKEEANLIASDARSNVCKNRSTTCGVNKSTYTDPMFLRIESIKYMTGSRLSGGNCKKGIISVRRATLTAQLTTYRVYAGRNDLCNVATVLGFVFISEYCKRGDYGLGVEVQALQFRPVPFREISHCDAGLRLTDEPLSSPIFAMMENRVPGTSKAADSPVPVVRGPCRSRTKAGRSKSCVRVTTRHHVCAPATFQGFACCSSTKRAA